MSLNLETQLPNFSVSKLYRTLRKSSNFILGSTHPGYCKLRNATDVCCTKLSTIKLNNIVIRFHLYCEVSKFCNCKRFPASLVGFYCSNITQLNILYRANTTTARRLKFQAYKPDPGPETVTACKDCEVPIMQ